MFLAGFGTYLVSKEIYVLEHEFYCGVALFGKCCRILLLGVKQKKFKIPLLHGLVEMIGDAYYP